MFRYADLEAHLGPQADDLQPKSEGLFGKQDFNLCRREIIYLWSRRERLS